MDDLKKEFEKEPYSKKVVLACALAALVSTFLPWWTVSFGELGGISVNGWNRFGILTGIAAAAFVALWILPKVGVKIAIKMEESLQQKILSICVLAGPVISIMESSFAFSLIGFGMYIALAAGAIACYFSFVKGNAAKGSSSSAPSSK